MSFNLRTLISAFLCFIISIGFAQSPYQMRWKDESYHLAVGGATFVTGLVFASQVNGFSAEEVAAHDRMDVNPFDRGATYNSSLTSQNCK